MENRIHQVVKLDNGNNFVILKQAIFKNESYYIASKLDENNKPNKDELSFFHQVSIDGQLKFENVTNCDLMKYLYSYMQI